ncbi:MAG: alginate export family protein [Planctomycetes bacterium]|nr:alginate export family protein [Planctomycetota bacterium]
MTQFLFALPIALLSLPSFAFAQDAGTSSDFEIGGSLRFRAEQRDPVEPLTVSESQSDQLGRLRLHAGTTFGTGNRALIEVQSTMLEPGGTFDLTLRQAFTELDGVFGQPLSMRIGRSELHYGNGRMVSNFDWSTSGNVFDLVRIRHANDSLTGDVILSQSVAGQGAAEGDFDDTLYAGYVQTEVDAPIGKLAVDAYALHRNLQPGWSDDTYGFLVSGENGDVDWDAEFAFQSGDHGGLSAGGNAFSLVAVYPLRPRLDLGIGYDYASGPSGGEDGFVPLWDDHNSYQGRMDIVRWSNLSDFYVTSSYAINKSWKAHADVHILNKAEDAGDIMFGVGGGAATSVSGESAIGTEIDIYLEGSMGDGMPATIGVGQFSAGDGISGGGDQSWIFAMIGVNF